MNGAPLALERTALKLKRKKDLKDRDMKITKRESNHLSPQGKELKMTRKMRTEINDLPEIAIELPEEELRIVSGGLIASTLACSSMAAKGTGGDGDHNDFV